MSILEDAFKGGKTATGIVIGLGAAVLAPVIVPVVAGIVKPLAKAAIKGGIVIYDKGKEVYAETVEVTEDLVAEARAELVAGAEAVEEQEEEEARAPRPRKTKE